MLVLVLLGGVGVAGVVVGAISVVSVISVEVVGVYWCCGVVGVVGVVGVPVNDTILRVSSSGIGVAFSVFCLRILFKGSPCTNSYKMTHSPPTFVLTSSQSLEEWRVKVKVKG